MAVIKWTRSDYIRLGKAVANFNKKRRELLNLGEKPYLPNEFNYKDLKETIKTRSQLRSTINSLKRFMKENAEKPVTLEGGQVVSRWEKNENKILKSKAIRQLNRRLKKLAEPTKYGFSLLQMGTGEVEAIRSTIGSLRKLEQKTGFEYKRIHVRLEELGRSDYNTIKAIIYRENFMKAFKSYTNVDGYKLLLRKFNSIKSPEEFFKFIQKSSVFSDIYLYYDKNKGLTYGNFKGDQDRFNYGLEELRNSRRRKKKVNEEI